MLVNSPNRHKLLLSSSSRSNSNTSRAPSRRCYFWWMVWWGDPGSYTLDDSFQRTVSCLSTRAGGYIGCWLHSSRVDVSDKRWSTSCRNAPRVISVYSQYRSAYHSDFLWAAVEWDIFSALTGTLWTNFSRIYGYVMRAVLSICKIVLKCFTISGKNIQNFLTASIGAELPRAHQYSRLLID